MSMHIVINRISSLLFNECLSYRLDVLPERSLREEFNVQMRRYVTLLILRYTGHFE